MYKLNSILENQSINELISYFKRSPKQFNKPHESDSEIIEINNQLLAITTDSISEEIYTGLYKDPYLIGWMIVTINISDLAAVGASPVGILISEIIPKNISNEKIAKMQNGILDACNAYGTFVLGGDTNEGDHLILTGTAVGIIQNKNYMSRLGCKPVDILYSSGKLGSGNAYEISRLISQANTFTNYKPSARIKYGQVIREYASCCMDTSDGLISTLDQLMRLNKAGFELNKNWENSIDNRAVEFSKNLNIPHWLLLAGQHGEFELIFTIPQKHKNSFLEHALQNELNPIELGKVISDTEICIPLYNELISINTAYIRNLPTEANGDVNHYLKMLLDYDSQIKNEPSLNFTSH